jgi:hypothetical protein
MQIVAGKEKEYANWRAKNDDPYGRACFLYAEAWADEMEKAVAAGRSVEDVADSLSHEVDRRPGFGITGFMYGMAVSILAKCWIHGETLRRWHNLKTQIGTEGEAANERGSVLNPALINVEPRGA